MGQDEQLVMSDRKKMPVRSTLTVTSVARIIDLTPARKKIDGCRDLGLHADRAEEIAGPGGNRETRVRREAIVSGALILQADNDAV